MIVHCSAPSGEEKRLSRLVMDYITDEVLEVSDLAGEPHVSPDGQYLVTVDKDTNTIAVYRVKDNGEWIEERSRMVIVLMYIVGRNQ